MEQISAHLTMNQVGINVTLQFSSIHGIVLATTHGPWILEKVNVKEF